MSTIFDATALGPQGRVFDGSDVHVTVNGRPAVKNCIRSLAPGLKVEGVEYVYALGARLPFAKTKGVIKPNELTIQAFAGVSNRLLQMISPSGYYLDMPADLVISYDEASSPGISLIALALKMPTSSITIEGFTVTAVGDTIEVGGGVLVTEIVGMPLRVRMGGMAGAAK